MGITDMPIFPKIICFGIMTEDMRCNSPYRLKRPWPLLDKLKNIALMSYVFFNGKEIQF